ncbi:sugar phosphate isomerase/epimerase [Atlantibacter subterranea]|uniref:sugar phosphate isomerase/epimerase family protein n=1 Tax=Atlantibacter subterraneus TaxID=255519 RepID=UPI001182540A|nr:TIM barrel protein [Atlantibacter subterranea]TSJ59120.1 sugar phosphate isomerase/epimerase [Atlantibacter subterranea]
MRVSISNLAWDVEEDNIVATLLQEFAIDAIDIAPGKYFSNVKKAKSSEIRAVKAWWAERGIELVGMQALLFGTSGLNVFGTETVQKQLLEHLSAICFIGAELGATRLVFGSPKNRDCSGLSSDEIASISTGFFRRLGDIASDNGVIICLEPNPEVYGANFMTTSHETCEVVKQIAHPSIKMQLDTGAMMINNEDYNLVMQESKPFIGHIHISEPQLLPPGDRCGNHEKLAEILKSTFPSQLATIEMLATKDESHTVSIRRALDYVTSLYR